MAGHNIDLIDDIPTVKSEDDSHGYTLKKYIELLMSSTNKFMVKPDKSLEYSLADFQGSFFLNFITIPIQIRG